ncbi:hypothetical protein P885DRAFT_25159, partial [Corynascus similis CBS 632.67]
EDVFPEFRTEPCCYDGTVDVEKLPKVQRQSEAATPNTSLIIATDAGGFGLNITCEGVIIQAEVWWNSNGEAQAVGRIWRQSHTEEVLYIQLFAEDSAIDWMISRVTRHKDKVNQDITEAIV